MSDQTPHGLNPILGKVWTHHDGVLPDGAVCRIADAQAFIATLTARCEALENALADEQTERDMHSDAAASAIKENVALRARCEALTAERDRLLAEKQADKDSFDNALAQFSAGYTQALDDAVKGTKP